MTQAPQTVLDMLVLVTVPFESTLNILWVTLGVAAVCAAWRAAYLRAASNRPKRFQVLCVVLVVAALFPFISSTDDIVRLQELRTQQQQSGPADGRAHDNLVRLYEAMDAPIAGEFHRLVVTFSSVPLVSEPVQAVRDRAIPHTAGRSPPTLS